MKASSAALVGACVVYSALAVAGEPRSWHLRIATALPGVAFAAHAVRLGWLKAGRLSAPVPMSRPLRTGLIVWGVLLGLTGLFIWATVAHHPRSVYPTLSHLADTTFDSYPLRVAGFGSWLALGWFIIRR